MKNFKNRFLNFLLCTIFVFSCSLSVFASQSQLDKTIKDKNKIQSSINESEKKKNTTEAEKKKIDNKVTELSDQLEAITLSLNSLGEKKDKIEKELKEAEDNKEKQEKTFKKRLRSIYEDGAISYFSVLLSSESIFDFFYNIELLKQISEYDNNVLESLKEIEEEIKVKKTELDSVIKTEQEKKNQLKATETSLKNESAKKEKYMKELEKDIEAYKKKLDEIEKQEAALRAEIARQSKNSGGPSKFVGGTFAWPSPGVYTITCPYGMRVHPITKQYKLHTGVDIGAPSGTSVVAAADGVVIISGNHTAYGKYISINHGGGVATLYAHNSQLLVSVGQTVKKGQTIAKSGNTGWSTGPHLHFEVIINGSTVNPMSYFK